MLFLGRAGCLVRDFGCVPLRAASDELCASHVGSYEKNGATRSTVARLVKKKEARCGLPSLLVQTLQSCPRGRGGVDGGNGTGLRGGAQELRNSLSSGQRAGSPSGLQSVELQKLRTSPGAPNAATIKSCAVEKIHHGYNAPRPRMGGPG